MTVRDNDKHWADHQLHHDDSPTVRPEFLLLEFLLLDQSSYC